MSCLKGGYAHQHYDAVRDTITITLKETCPDVEIEPHLLRCLGKVLHLVLISLMQRGLILAHVDFR